MALFGLDFKFLLLALGASLVFLAVMTAWAIWVITIIRSKMTVETHLVWPVGLSLLASSAIIGIGNVEPFEELAILTLGHAIAWYFIQRKTLENSISDSTVSSDTRTKS